MSEFPVVIHHNPDCGTSRNVVAIVRAAGYEPEIIDYLKTGWSRPQLLALFAAAGLTPREALREQKSPAAELGLLEKNVSAEEIIAAMLEHPILVNRPIVATPKGVRLCRPSERVLELLDRRPAEAVYKEDGELIWKPLNDTPNTMDRMTAFEMLAPGDEEIQPSAIIHEIEDLPEGYNYVVYEFVLGDHYYWARSYLDQNDEVSIFGPMSQYDRSIVYRNASIDERVLKYFARRFKSVRRLSQSGYEEVR